MQISFSANQKYQMSARSYYLHYIRRLRPIKVGSALIFGASIDFAINAMLRNKMLGQNFDVRKMFCEEWEEQPINGVMTDLRHSELIQYSKSDMDESIFTEDDFEIDARPQWVSLRRKGLMILDAYQEQILPRIEEVIAIQKDVKITNSSGDTFIGFIDFIAKWEGKTVLFDNKTSSITYKPDSAYTSPQLATYFQGTKDINIDKVGFIAIPKKFRKKKMPLIPIQVIVDDVDDDLIRRTFEEYDDTLRGIKMGEFPCTGCQNNPFGCVYQKFCDSDGEDLTGLMELPQKEY